MKSTEKLELNTNTIYHIVKAFYGKNFPYPTAFSAIEAINLSFSKGAYGRVVPGRFDVDPHEHPVYVGMHNEYTPVFKDPKNCADLVEDVKQLQKWLRVNGFISEDVATEKLISTKDLLLR